MIREILALLERTLGAGIATEVVLAEDLWPTLVDPVQLESAIANLANNGRDAMPGGGSLTITTRNVEIDAAYAAAHADAMPGEFAMIEVTDSGTGMPRDVQDHLFEPFFTTKGPERGTGLGLAMVYGFIKQSHGHISVESHVGIGTTFRLYLPRLLSD